MILPAKHIEMSESFLGLGAIILSIIKKPIFIDQGEKNEKRFGYIFNHKSC